MNSSQRVAFDFGWNSFKDSYSISDKRVLDIIYKDDIITTNEYQRWLEEARLEELLRLIRAALVGSNNGYDTFMTILNKNYNWIYDSVLHNEKLEKQKDDAHENAIVFGQVPSLPQYYIERTEKLENVKTHLINMTRGNKLVLHGMFGIGKSSLASAAIRDRELLFTAFNNKVFWITIDKNEDVLPIMYRLFRKIVLSDPDLEKMRNIDKPATIEQMKDDLILLFQETTYRNALIVLDNVSSSNVVSHFDIGCNVLIISQERVQLNQNNVTFIEIEDSFSSNETNRLFAISFEMEHVPGNGPEKIHNWCKGDPMMISLVAADVCARKEKFLSDPTEWDRLIKRLDQKKNNTVNEKRHEMIKWVIDKLPPDLKSKFLDFAIFVEDINLIPEVLMILWGSEATEVEEIMAKYTNKSLTVSQYSNDLHTYIYEIHPVCLNFLKKNLKGEDLVNMHKKLVIAYTDKYDYANLPNDNYIYQYIGYHLHEAKMYEEFKVYFDLNFIGAKIRATGIADVLRDFNIYEKYITKGDQTLKEKLNHYIDFVNKYGQNLNIYENTDIVQSALFLSSENPLYKAAKKIANDRPTNLYFQILAPHDSNYYVHELTLNNNFKAACFSEETNKILVGTEAGAIELWEGLYTTKLENFEEHTQSITSLKVNISRDMFLSISEDGDVKLWNLAKGKTSHTENGYNSPRVTQTAHQTRFGFEASNKKCLQTLNISNDKLISAAFSNNYAKDHLILTGSEEGIVMVWKNPQEKFVISRERKKITSVNFSNDNSLIIFSSGRNIFLYQNNRTDTELAELKTQYDINDVHIVPDDDVLALIAVQDSCLTYWHWEEQHMPNNRIEVKNVGCHDIFNSHNSTSTFQCSTIIENYFVAATSDMRIKMWDIEKNTIVEDFYHPNGPVICLDACLNHEDQSIHILLTGFGDKTLKMWHVKPNENEAKKIKKLPIYAVHWNESSNSPLLAVANSINKIQIMKGYNLVAEIDQIGSKIEAVTFSLNGNIVYYGLNNGLVFSYEIKTKRNLKIMNLETTITYLENVQLQGSILKIDELLVASSNKGKLIIYLNGVSIKLVDKCHVNTPLLKCFHMDALDKLLTISKGQIRSWDLRNLKDCSSEVIYSNSKGQSQSSHVTTCVSNDKSLLCFTTDNNFQVFHLDFDKEFSKNYHLGHNLQLSITSCCFSANNSYLALGLIDGTIKVRNLADKTYIVLDVHRTFIRDLQFSPSGLIMMSVAEQMAWWNLEKVPQDSTRRSFRSRSNSTKKRISFDLNQMSLLNLDWSNKKGPNTKPHLLSCIKFHGMHANKVSFSQDFKSFLTVDDQGELYIMDVFDS